MPKIVVPTYEPDTTDDNKAAHEETNKTKLEAWFTNSANWAGLEDQLTKRLGSDKFKNVKLTYASVTLTDFTAGRGITRWNPTVKFSVKANEGYTLDTNSTKEIDLVVRVLYKSAEANAANVFTHEGASSSAAPNRASNPNDETTIKTVNVYLNYTGPEIMLNAELPKVGSQENTSLNGTSNVTGAFNTKFKDLVTSDQRTASLFFQAIQKYVNTFDPKYPAKPISDQKNGVTWARVVGNALKIGELSETNTVFVQQMQNDTKAAYFAVTAIASNSWLNTFLIRIPLTKFVKPVAPFAPAAPTQEASGDQAQADPQATQMGTKAQS